MILGAGFGRARESELGQRIMSAIVLLAVVIGVAWIGGTAWWLLATALSAVLFYEWQGMVRTTPFDTPDVLLTVGFIAILLSGAFDLTLYVVLAFVLLGFILEQINSGQERSDVRWMGVGALYCAIPELAFPIIREVGGFAPLLFVFVCVWMTDVVAYFTGRKLQGPKLMPTVSPNKTWSGALGGVLGAIITAGIFMLIFPTIASPWWIALAIVLSVCSQTGDLFESWVKRRSGKKDSSGLIPGHGGFLDRVDGLLFACVPVALIYGLQNL
ncbi:phosphatidate cytidylyltransferase [Ahrensia sp. R2A130]|uniref:phosphatidate cytidylyltransferase n=1 Tax=Ahrensia sp. R2A130 TaxID=744979 RepID=UPI0001E0C994|nr:phosphatidate cytidylyltransferase [Ahrensia sp. R2A130]EFL90237.1 phosphatidate cytidylyltransferase [Ahrensia sp. R2A130]